MVTKYPFMEISFHFFVKFYIFSVLPYDDVKGAKDIWALALKHRALYSFNQSFIVS